MVFHLRRRRLPDGRSRLPLSESGWIAAGRRPFEDYIVGSLVPTVFETYMRVLHPARSPKGELVRWDAVAAWSGRTMHALAQWDALSRPLRRVEQPSPFDQPPRTDGLTPDGLAVLVEVLAAHTSDPGDCYIGIWEGYGGVEAWAGAQVVDLENRSYHVRRGPLSLAIEVGLGALPGSVPGQAPNLLWPADRSWFVASDTDLDSTYLGGSAALAVELLAYPGLEVWPVDANDRISIESDHLNRP